MAVPLSVQDPLPIPERKRESGREGVRESDRESDRRESTRARVQVGERERERARENGIEERGAKAERGFVVGWGDARVTVRDDVRVKDGQGWSRMVVPAPVSPWP